VKKIIWVFVAMTLLSAWTSAFAGPPFRTDDPEPVGYHHGEVYLFTAGTRNANGVSGVGPAIEFNYGIFPDTQFHVVTPVAFNAPHGEASHFGYGDTELGIKYRFSHQNDVLPDMGVFPLVEIPSGQANEGLGNGKARYFLPVWLQKDFGKWTTYGGGGYWVNPGEGNRNWWLSGVLLQYSFAEDLYLGGEIFHQTADTIGGKDSTSFNVGGSLPLFAEFQLLFSAGSGLHHSSKNRFTYYAAIYHAF
jgi:Putative MetA-pathway of phenol degradation